MSTPKFRVAISGAGIGGLALAVTIGRHSDVPIDLYEAGPEITTVGAGIGVWKRTLQILRKLGLEGELEKNVLAPTDDGEKPGLAFRHSDVSEEGSHFYTMQYPYDIIPIHRSTMVDILKNNLPPSCKIHLSKRLAEYKQEKPDGPITLHFTDGSTSETDILIGADGVRSATRASLFETLAKSSPSSGVDCRQFISAKFSGTYVYRCLIPTEKIKAVNPAHSALRRPTSYCGKHKHVTTYPIMDGRFLNVTAFCTEETGERAALTEKWVLDVPAEEVRDCYKGWESELTQILQHVDKVSRWAVHVLYDLPLYASERVAILGDAAHAMGPHLGSGAGQAIEDAYVLGRLLTRDETNLGNISKAMDLYQEVRLPFGNKVASDSSITGKMYEFTEPGLYDGVDRSQEKEKLQELGEQIMKKWEFQWATSFDEQWEHTECFPQMSSQTKKMISSRQLPGRVRIQTALVNKYKL